MAQVNFYHLTHSSLTEALPTLVLKAAEADFKVVISVDNLRTEKEIDTLLWGYKDTSFLPHSNSQSKFAEESAIHITSDMNKLPFEPTMLFIIGGHDVDHIGSYERCMVLFDGKDEAAVQGARVRWSNLNKEGAHSLTYWQQNTEGRWQKKV